MNLSGNLKVGDEQFYLYWADTKSKETFVLFNKYHKEDRYRAEMGEPLQYPEIPSYYNLKAYCTPSYVEEILTRTKASGKIKVFNDSQIIETVLNTISFARNYQFSKQNIIKDDTVQALTDTLRSFYGKDQTLFFSCEQTNNFFSELKIEYGDVSLELYKGTGLNIKQFELTEIQKTRRKKILTKTIIDVDYQMLCDSSDMSWYQDGDIIKKDYQVIDNLPDFEYKIMYPLVMAIKEAQDNNQTLDVSLDTETSGLFVYNLSPDNEDKDHCVAVPISWKEETGSVIFTDMEFFNNVPNDYVAKRLGELFENFTGERTIKVYCPNKNSENELQHMNLFEDTVKEATLNENTIQYVTLKRKSINLIGHNVMFDKRVFIDLKKYFYFDNDTLQMAFDLNPKLVKGSNKLKTLTRKIFGHETPELSDILGKGNEDKYRYLRHKIVAMIYGCADGDYTLKLFHFLKKLMTKRMYYYYQRQDIPLLNILPRSEYYGMNTYADKVLELADNTLANIEKLKQFTYEYVGAFVDVYRQRAVLEAKKSSGFFINDEEYQKAIQDIKPDPKNKLEFEFKPAELRRVLFDILKYPIKAWTTGKKPQPKIDKYAMKKLVAVKRKEGEHFNKLEKDVLVAGASEEEYEQLRASLNPSKQKKADDMVLISASKFNSLKYPLALVLQKYAEINKEYTGYYKPIKENNLEGKIFKSYSLARIETRRISNPAQTMKGSLKALVRSYTDDYYLVDFDMSQVEYRIMLSLSKHMIMVDRMKDPEKDYHTETASMVNAIPPHRVSKKIRKMAKGVSFGVPYGLGEMSLCETLFGEINAENLFATRMLLAKWESNNRPVMEFLNKQRDNALLAREMSIELRDFMDAWVTDENGNYVLTPAGTRIPKPIGFVENELGFYRTFDLSDISQTAEAKERRRHGHYNKEEGKIRRPAGNFPIQSFAAELFRIILIRFYNRCEEEGINDKIIWHMLIHDELLCSVHKSIHPFYMYKIIKESCMVTMKGHTSYFVGINIGNTWAETKDDAREAPVYFVDRIIKRWDDGEFGNGPFWFNDPWEELIKDERAKYVDTRINEVIHEVQPDIDTEPINIPAILDNFSNYTVRAYVNDYDQNFEVQKCKDEDEEKDRIWSSKFETWALGHFPIGKPLINYDGELVVLRKKDYVADKTEDDFSYIDTSELFNDDEFADNSYWSFDSAEANSAYDSDIVDESVDDDIFDYEIDTECKGITLAQVLKQHNEYQHLKNYGNQIILTVTKEMIPAIKEYLSTEISRDGISVVFKYSGCVDKWVKVHSKIDLKELDSFIETLYEEAEIYAVNMSYTPMYFNTLGTGYVIEVNNAVQKKKVLSLLASKVNPSGAIFFIKDPLTGLSKLNSKVLINFKELDSQILQITGGV